VFCDFLTLHGYPGYADFTTGPTDERLLPFLTLLTRYLGGGKDVFFTEFGVPTQPLNATELARLATSGPQLVSEAEAAAYLRRALDALQQCGATGAMMWCHTDYATALFDTPPLDLAPHERSFGLFHADGSPKPAVSQVLEFSREHHMVQRKPLVQEAQFIDIAAKDYFSAPQVHLRRLYQKYCALR
jgi:endo-1,4-beta-mannosidase